MPLSDDEIKSVLAAFPPCTSTHEGLDVEFIKSLYNKEVESGDKKVLAACLLKGEDLFVERDHEVNMMGGNKEAARELKEEYAKQRSTILENFHKMGIEL